MMLPPPLPALGVGVLVTVPLPAMVVKKLDAPLPVAVVRRVGEAVGVLDGVLVMVGVGVMVTVGVAVGQRAAFTFAAGSAKNAMVNITSTMEP